MLRKIALSLFLTAIITAPLGLYAHSAWIPGARDADMAASTMLGRAIDLTGLLATSFITVAVLLTVRFKVVTRSVPHPELRAIHRYFGLLAVTAAFMHLVLLLLSDHHGTIQRILYLPAGRAGLAALTGLIMLGLTSRLSAPGRSARSKTTRYRERRAGTLRARHPDAWRLLHLSLAIGAATATALHVYLLQHMMESTAYRWLFLVLGEGVALALLTRYVLPVLRTSNAYRVVEVKRSTRSILRLVLAAPTGADVLRFRAGQFAYLRTRKAPISPERPFTISSSHHDSETVEFTIRISDRPRSFTRQLMTIKPGMKVYLDGPHGTLGAPVTTVPIPIQTEKTLLPSGTPGMIGITQGVGITPCLSLLRTLADAADTRAHSLLVAVRSKNDLLTFRRELDELTRNLRLRITFSTIEFNDSISSHNLIKFLPPGDERKAFEYVLCGPSAFLTNVYTQLVHMGVPRRKLHTETLLSAGVSPLGPGPVMPEGHPSAPFRKRDNHEAPSTGSTERAPSDHAGHDPGSVDLHTAGGDGVPVFRR
jgi:predicted ferric reductase